MNVNGKCHNLENIKENAKESIWTYQIIQEISRKVSNKVSQHKGNINLSRKIKENFKETSRKMSRTRIPTRKIYFKLHFAHFGSVKIKTCEYITGNIIFNLFWYQGCYPADMWLDEKGEGLTSLTCVYTKGTGICPYVATSVKDVRKAEIWRKHSIRATFPH